MREYPNHRALAEAEFAQILREIKKQDWSTEEWARDDVGDWFQTEHFLGSFEADASYRDGAFAFSYYDQNGKQWCFSFRLEDIGTLEAQGLKGVVLADPETSDMLFERERGLTDQRY